MVKDFVPVRSEISTGVVIKQHMLERNRVRPPQTEISQHDYSGSLLTGFISGGTGGVFDSINMLTSSVSPQITQSWAYEVDTQFGPQIVTQSTQDEFYNGELSGSDILVTDGELGVIPPLGTTQTSKTYFYASSGGAYENGITKFDDPSSFETAIINTSAGNTIRKSLYYLDEPNNGISQMAIGYDSNTEQAFSSSLESLNYGDTFTVTFTDVGGYTPQPINVPYTFTVSSVIKFSNYFRISFTTPPSQPVPSSYLLNGIPSTGFKLIDVDLRVDIINTPPGNLALLKEANPIINNAVNPTTSNTYQTIDYSDSVTTPTNISQIITNTAVKAPIQDSNYSSAKWSNSRYKGSRMSSPDFNIKSR